MIDNKKEGLLIAELVELRDENLVRMHATPRVMCDRTKIKAEGAVEVLNEVLAKYKKDD